jgi:hypothetical protein
MHVPFFFAISALKIATPLGVQLQDNFRHHQLALVLLKNAAEISGTQFAVGWV